MPKPIAGVKRYLPVRLPVEGLEWTGGNADAMAEFAGECALGPGTMLGTFRILTMTGPVTLVQGDYAIKNTSGRMMMQRGGLMGRYYELVVDELAIAALAEVLDGE